MKVAVVGTGYVGLVTGVCFAELGNDVVCVDNDATKVAGMQKGQVPIYEPGLDAYLNVRSITIVYHLRPIWPKLPRRPKLSF